MAKFRCTVCNWVYDEDREGKAFSKLSDTYTCPVCGSPKSAFVPDGIHKGDEEIETTVAEKLVEQLVALGVTHVFGIPGDSNLPLVDSIRKNSDIRFILTRHEETAAFMAAAQGKIADRLGVCVSIAGPGSTNLITGLMDSATDRSPVIALLGQIPEIYLGSEAFQEIDQIQLFQPFAEYAETVARSNQAIRITMMAAKYAFKKPGVSVLSTPTDVLVDKLDEDIVIPEKRVFENFVIPSDDSIERAAKLIAESNRPVVFAGWGSRHCGDILVELVEKLNAPVATTSRAKGVIDETHEYALGVLGSIGTKHAAQAIRSCDLIIIIGSGFRQANLVPPDVKIIQIDIDPTRVGKTFDVDVGIVGDGTETLKKLVPAVESKSKNEDFLDEVFEIRNKHLEEIEADGNDQSYPINPGYVIQSLKRNVSSDAIICVDVGDHTYWFYKKFICEGQRTYLCANMASMGFSLPASMTAKINYPDKQVICLSSDGGFAMLMADFTTAVREELDVKVILFNDGKLKNIKKEQNRDGYPEYGVSFPNPNFAKYAETCSAFGVRVSKAEELDSALKEAFKHSGPALVEVMIDSERMAASTKSAD